MASANQNATISRHGIDQLRVHEGVMSHYYNDAPKGGNCTFGVGTMAYLGACRAEDLGRAVPPEKIAESLGRRLRQTEREVRLAVDRQPLTQDQFDALVSFVYNLGAHGARGVLRQVNSGDLTGAADSMSRYVYMTLRDGKGHPMRGPDGSVQHKLLPGLVRRRTDESAALRSGPPKPKASPASPWPASPSIQPRFIMP
jgi:lysozyme